MGRIVYGKRAILTGMGIKSNKVKVFLQIVRITMVLSSNIAL